MTRSSHSPGGSDRFSLGDGLQLDEPLLEVAAEHPVEVHGADLRVMAIGLGSDPVDLSRVHVPGDPTHILGATTGEGQIAMIADRLYLFAPDGKEVPTAVGSVVAISSFRRAAMRMPLALAIADVRRGLGAREVAAGSRLDLAARSEDQSLTRATRKRC
jgi:hypothetical protein